MSKILIYLFIFNFSLLANSQDACFTAKIESFQGFMYYRDSLPYSIDIYQSNPVNDCLKDTAELIKFMGSKIFFGKKRKNKFTYTSSYLPMSTHPYSLGYNKPKDPYLSVMGPLVPGKEIPVELIKLYYIYALYESDFYFRPKIRAGVDGYLIGEGDVKKDARLMKDAENSLSTWLILLESHGLQYLRNEKISPLHFSKLKWE